MTHTRTMRQEWRSGDQDQKPPGKMGDISVLFK